MANYFSLVKETVTERWSQYSQPLRINDDDLTAGITLFTKIAFDRAKSPNISASREISLELDGTVDKIKAFVECKVDTFISACQTGFPFSLLESSATEIALKHALEKYDSILSSFLMVDDRWMSEKELEELFNCPFQHLEASGIAEACSDLASAHVRNKDNKAGYYLLWLVKRATGCVYEIPEKVDFNDKTVAKVLSDFFAGSGSLTNAANFIEILLYRGWRVEKFLYQKFLDQKAFSIFLNFAVGQLAEIPMDKWPSKAVIITEILELVTREGKLAVAKALASSQDTTTAEVGNQLLAALTASSLNEAIPHFYALKELLPHFNHSHFPLIFGHAFVEFRREIPIKYPEFTKWLSFNEMRKVFVHGSLMIGVYAPNVPPVPPHLLAYDMNTEKMVWGIPLGPRYTLQKVGELLTLQFEGEKKLHFIHPETGEFDSILELPKAPTDDCDGLHISPEGFVYIYQHQDEVLIGGKIIDKRWNPSFEAKASVGEFRPFSTHSGVQQYCPEDRLVLFGPTGNQVIIKGSVKAEAHDDKLYLIEKDPTHKDKCLVTIRTLKLDNEVVSGVEKSISLNVKEAFFGKICPNGQVVLFSGSDYSGFSPIFVDLHRQEVIYSQHKVHSYQNYNIITDSGELWNWDDQSKEIWKVSSTSTTLMGSLEGSRDMTLLHVDQADRLYFADM